MIPFWVDFSISGLVQLSALIVAVVGWFVTIFASHTIRG